MNLAQLFVKIEWMVLNSVVRKTPDIFEHVDVSQKSIKFFDNIDRYRIEEIVFGVGLCGVGVSVSVFF